MTQARHYGRCSASTLEATHSLVCLIRGRSERFAGRWRGPSSPTQHIELLHLAGNAGEKTRKLYQAKVDAINRLEPSMQALSDDQLRDKTRELQQRIAGGASLDDVLVESFAVSSHQPVLSAMFHAVRSPVMPTEGSYMLYTVICMCTTRMRSAGCECNARVAGCQRGVKACAGAAAV